MKLSDKKSDDPYGNSDNTKERREDNASYNPLPKEEVKPPTPIPPPSPIRVPKPSEEKKSH